MKIKAFWNNYWGSYTPLKLAVLTVGCLTVQPYAGATDSASNYIKVSQLPRAIPQLQEPFQPSPSQPPSTQPILPPPNDLLRISPTSPLPNEAIPASSSETIIVKEFKFKFDRTNLESVHKDENVGKNDKEARDAKIAAEIKSLEDRSLVFGNEELQKVVAGFLNRPISFAELLQARTAITKLYISKGYITSGAYIPEQATLTQNGKVIVEIRVVEGILESPRITISSLDGRDESNNSNDDLFDGSSNLEHTIRDSLVERFKPLSRDRLLNRLQILQKDPRVKTISATLSLGDRPGISNLSVEVIKQSSFFGQLSLDNGRSPVVGSLRHRAQIVFGTADSYGFGDPSLGLKIDFTRGSETIDVSGSLPINSFSLSARYIDSGSTVVEPPFDQLLIDSPSRYYEITGRYRVLSTPEQDLLLGVTVNHQRSFTTILGEPVPLLPGGDGDGLTQIWALRLLLPEWTKRSNNSIFAFRSQLSIGLNFLGSSSNIPPPNGKFLAWRGQFQWIRRLAPETLFIARADAQWADRPLVPLEQFGIGGSESVRGYRQDFLLTDNGVLGSVELQLPVLRIPNWRSKVYFNPFVDYGVGWNNGGFVNPKPNALAATGFGLQWRHQDESNRDRLIIQFSLGIPLVDVDSNRDTLQDKGIYFSVIYNFY
ncbi:MAG: ShlB/FhaC/HecB family hemolysin secretion/activation protein (plasmid) [Leptolyngbya sp. BL-A-14]